MLRAATLSEAFLPVERLLEMVDRLYGQLDLVERRWVHEAAVLVDHPLKKEPVSALPLFSRGSTSVGSVAVDAVGPQKGCRPVGLWGNFFVDGAETPLRKLIEKYLKKQGWEVDYR